MTSTNEIPDIFIQGDGIYLRALTEADLEGNWYRWFNEAPVLVLFAVVLLVVLKPF